MVQVCILHACIHLLSRQEIRQWALQDMDPIDCVEQPLREASISVPIRIGPRFCFGLSVAANGTFMQLPEESYPGIALRNVPSPAAHTAWVGWVLAENGRTSGMGVGREWEEWYLHDYLSKMLTANRYGSGHQVQCSSITMTEKSCDYARLLISVRAVMRTKW